MRMTPHLCMVVSFFASVDARTVEEKQGITCNSPACAARLRNTGVFWNKKNDAHR